MQKIPASPVALVSLPHNPTKETQTWQRKKRKRIFKFSARLSPLRPPTYERGRTSRGTSRCDCVRRDCVRYRCNVCLLASQLRKRANEKWPMQFSASTKQRPALLAPAFLCLHPHHFRSLLMKILPKEQRLGDTRTMRELSNERTFRASRRRNSAKAVTQWKDLKNDKRFALPALAHTYEKLGIYLGHHVSNKLHVKEFAPHPAIPEFAYRFTAAHVSQTDHAKIACYPTIGDAKRGREIVMSPGKFFAAIYPDASPSDIQRMAEKYACAVVPALVHIAEDEDDFARVYASARGFSSCMAGKWDGDDETNPVRFYAHPENDLALAYLTHNNKPRGETVARSIINTKNKCYVRVYGDARLADLLSGMGYERNGERALRNQKCNARTNDDGDLIAPYLDAIQRVSWNESSDWCRISSDGDYAAAETNGIASREDDRSTCDCCGDREDSDSMSYSEHHEIEICEGCARRNYTMAIYDTRGNETYIRDDEVITVGGTAYLDDSDVLSAHNLVQDEDGDWQDMDDCVYLEYLNEYVLVSLCTALDFDFGDDSYARDSDLKTVHVDGEEKIVHEDWEDEDGITDEWKEENEEEDSEESEDSEEEDAGKFPAAHARPDDSTARIIATVNSEAGCNAAMIKWLQRPATFDTLNKTCRDLTGFTSFADLLNAAGYRPTIDVSEPRLFVLANAYDAAQQARGDDRRAYRYGKAAHVADVLHVIAVRHSDDAEETLWFFDSLDEANKAHAIARNYGRVAHDRGTIPESELPQGDYITDASELANCLDEIARTGETA